MTAPLRLTFIQSAARVGELPGSPVEVAFVGRSNVGKSSLINALANQKQLARVSNTPGRTQLINMFSADRANDRDKDSTEQTTGTVVDLPGYGYAKASKTVRRGWPAMIEGYLLGRENLVMVFVLVDGEIGPTKLDVQMLEWLRYNVVPHTVVDEDGQGEIGEAGDATQGPRRRVPARPRRHRVGERHQGRRHRHVAIPRPHLDRHRPLTPSATFPGLPATSPKNG